MNLYSMTEFITRAKTKIGFSIAKVLQPYLSRTPVVWGDPSRLITGEGVVLVNAVLNLRSGKIKIGDYSFMGHGVMLLTGLHDIRKTGIHRQTTVRDLGRDITIGSGVWIASGAIVIGPCEIGDNAVISSGCVITKSVPSDTLCVNNADGAITMVKIDYDKLGKG